LDLVYLCIIRDLKKYSNITYNSKTISAASRNCVY
jgi:hypothetical protein